MGDYIYVYVVFMDFRLGRAEIIKGFISCGASSTNSKNPGAVSGIRGVFLKHI